MTTVAFACPTTLLRRPAVLGGLPHCVLVLGMLIGLLGGGQAFAQGSSALAIAERARDFGRMTLTFRDRLDLPAHQIDVENGVLRVVFEEPVETDIRDAVRVLSDFVTIARRDPDGMALRFGLASAVRINTMEAGETLFIDFLPASWQGFPPPLPAEVVAQLSARAQQAALEAAQAERRRLLGELEPQVLLRVGKAPTFTRYSFDWNVPYQLAVTQEGPELTMVFDFDVPIDLSPALIDKADELEAITSTRDPSGLQVALSLVPGSRVRWFEDGQSFIVDIDREEIAQGEQAQDEADAIARALAQFAPSPADGGMRFQAALGDVEPVVAVEDETVQESAQSNSPLADQQLVLAAQPGDGPATVAAPNAEGTIPAQPVQPASDPLSQRPDVASAPQILDGGRPPEAMPSAQVSEQPDMVRVEVRHDGDMARIVFPFSRPTAAAVFRRGNTVTLLFETAVPLDLRSLRSELTDQVRSVTPSRVDRLNMVHLELRGGAMVSAVPSGDRWIVALGPAVLEPPAPVQVGRGIDPNGGAFAEIVNEGFGSLFEVIDPQVGDSLMVAPMLPPAVGALASQSFVEFELLSSAQGVVLRPKIDTLEVTVEPSRLLISRERGLSLSELGLSLGTFGFSPAERPGYVDLRALIGQGPSSFEERYHSYQTQIAAGDGPVRVERLIEFARFLLAFELGQEANGILDIALSEQSSLEHDPAFLTVRAAALTVSGRHQEARQILGSHAMATIEDSRVWGLLADAGLRNWADVNANYDEAASLFSGYPNFVIAQARIAGVEAALEMQAVDLASDRLRQIDPLLIPPRQHAALDLLAARLALAKGRVDEALEGLGAVMQADRGPAAARAALYDARARIQSGALSPAEGLEALENLAVAWRGDDTEVQTRALLGELYVQDGRFGDALLALKGVVIAQPDHPMAVSISEQMQTIFVELFLNGQADNLPAIDALSLFYDFRELTPIGRRGDELVRRLADRLVEIDLLDQAADLLAHQVDNRLTGTAKAQIAADLALIYLMDYRPAEAVATLQRTRMSQVPMSIERVRRIIEARALSELGRHELALEVLRSIDGDDAAAVRADVLWNAENWQGAGEAIERLLAQRWSDSVPLDDREMQQVLRAAIGYSFASDDYALERLRARFSAKMSDGVFASAFDVVTAPIDNHGPAFREVARSIAGLNTLNRFLEDYRSTFSSQALSPATPGA